MPHLQTLLGRAQASYALALPPSERVLAHSNMAETGKTYADIPTGDQSPKHRQIVHENQTLMDIFETEPIHPCPYRPDGLIFKHPAQPFLKIPQKPLSKPPFALRVTR